jgi:uncharacterized protein (DUF1778 family)
MSALPKSPSTRLDFRLAAEQKKLIERAASVHHQTLSTFAVSVLLKAAEETLHNASARALSVRDSQAFLAMLDQEPNAALRAAAKRYKERRAR